MQIRLKNYQKIKEIRRPSKPKLMHNFKNMKIKVNICKDQ